MDAQIGLLAHLVAVEGLAADHVRARVGAPGLPDRAHRPGALAEQRARAAPVGVLLLEAAARCLGAGVLGERARLPAVDQIGPVGPPAVGRDVDLRHQPASVVAEAVTRGGDPRVVPRAALVHLGRPVGVAHDVAVGVAVDALGGVAVIVVRRLGELEQVGVGVALVVHVAVRGVEGRLRSAGRRLHHVGVLPLARQRVEHGHRMRRLDAARQRLARGRLRARVGGHERQLVVIVEALDRVRRRRLAADRSGQARVVRVRLREAPALAVEGVGRVLVLARIDGEAGRRVVEVARELLVHLEGDLPPPPLLLIPAVAEQPVRRRALAEGACRCRPRAARSGCAHRSRDRRRSGPRCTRSGR